MSGDTLHHLIGWNVIFVDDKSSSPAKTASLFEAFSCPWTSSSTFYRPL